MIARLFCAVRFSDAVVAGLEREVDKLRREAVDGVFTRRENLHLTLAFIGETDRFSDVRAALNEVEFQPFELSLGGLGRFRRDEGDIYWLGVSRCEELLRAQRALVSALTIKGFKLESRAFSPHLTLGRQVVLPVGTDFDDVSPRFGSFTDKISSISLMKSERVRGRLTYTELASKAASI